MNDDTKADPNPALAEHWARKGANEVEKMYATVTLARQFLVSGEVQPYVKGENPFDRPPFPWEVTGLRADAPRRIFLGTVSDLATGEGHTVYFAAGLSRDEDEFRRQLADHIGHTLADGAKVDPGLEDFQFSQTFISPPLLQTLGKFDEGNSAPAGFFFLSRWHENRT